MMSLYCQLLHIVIVLTLSHSVSNALQGDSLQWIEVANETALCSDYTKAGFFLSQNQNSNDPNSTKWVIFLESGSLCFSGDNCNRRFFADHIRSQFSRGPSFFPTYGDFDPRTVWDATVNSSSPIPPVDIINPIMSSVGCFQNSTRYFPNGFQVSGRDILHHDPQLNQLFPGHNHVIIPYCSSDVWLGEDVDGSPCDCFDFQCFGYVPNSPNLQFTFRGKTIFQSVIRQLISDHRLGGATEVVLAGSSAGGVGVVNHAHWVQEQISVDATLLVIMDSSWFINFQDSIFRKFDGAVSQAQSLSQSQGGNRLLQIIESHPPCTDYSLGYPCCLTPHCLLTITDNVTGSPLYFPSNVRIFTISSLYDAFLLAPSVQQSYANSLQRASMAPRNLGSTQSPEELVGTDFALDFLRLSGEYGGAMNTTLIDTANRIPNFSFYLPQCLQHIYLATSTLWGVPGSSLFGDNGVELALGVAQFSHTVMSDRWITNLLATPPPQTNSTTAVDLTIQQALLEWYTQSNTSVYQYRAQCQGPYCYDRCPDAIGPRPLSANSWPTGVKIIIAAVVLAVTFLCLAMKCAFVAWLHFLQKKQNAYLSSLKGNTEAGQDFLEFPHCEEEDAVSVSCVDIHYSVTYKSKADDSNKASDMTELKVIKALGEGNGDDFSVLESISELEHRHPSKKMAPTSSKKSSFTLPKSKTKEILKGISLYFNPGEMVAIMGPSGCGKTTFLDLLTARRKGGTITGEIFINGLPMNEVLDWYVSNTGYVLQLATPYYEELTVRENMTLATMMKLPNTFSLRDKFERTEQVMEVTGLSSLADTVVGGVTGPGLSGGQKRRLAVALQLIKLPSMVFLDEPTSGLDATSSFELLNHLNKLALSNRTVVLTIHQPRLEIFHMFNRLVLLTEGQVAYHGAPERAYEVFVCALVQSSLNQSLLLPVSELENHNPADMVMDMLGNNQICEKLVDQYNNSNEPLLVRTAIDAAIHKWDECDDPICEDLKNRTTDWIPPQPDVFTRIATHESRGAKSNHLVLFLPIAYFAFGFVLGTVYLQQTTPLLIISGVSVFAAAHGIFMFTAMYTFYTKALQVYSYEKADGVGRAVDLVIQGFIRYQAIAIFPVIISVTIHYLLLVNAASYDILVFLQVVVVNIALNQSWTALYIMLIVAMPKASFKVSSAVASVFSFTSGFYIPIEQLGWWLRWLVYINPNYYASSSVAVFILSDFRTNCVGSDLSCFLQSGVNLLRQFNFDNVNPYVHFLVLLGFTLLFIFLGIFFHWLRHTTIDAKIRGSKKEKKIDKFKQLPDLPEDESPKTKAKKHWKYALSHTLHNLRQETVITESPPATPYLNDGELHDVWIPKNVPKLAYIVSDVMKSAKQGGMDAGNSNNPSSESILSSRRRGVLHRVSTAQAVFRRLSTTNSNLPLEMLSQKISSEVECNQDEGVFSPSKATQSFTLGTKLQ